MKTVAIPTSAPNVSTIWSALDKVKADLQLFSQEHHISQVLMLCSLRDWADNQLQTPIDIPND